MLKRLLVICSAHHKRGEKIKYFNMSPPVYETVTKIKKENLFTYRDQVIPIVCEGWQSIEGVWFHPFTTTEGNIISIEMTYAIYD